MAAQDNISILPPAKFGQTTFLASLWAGVAVSLCFLIFRLSVKLRSFHKFYADDYLVTFAWAAFLGFAVLWQTKVSTLYEQYAVLSGKAIPTAGFPERIAALAHSLIPLSILFYTCLWTVKLSVLLLFRRLVTKVRRQRIWWWCILVVTVLSWVACIADINYKCTTYCPSSSVAKFNNRVLYGNAAADVVTDCLIISIPVLLLWNVRIPPRKKAVLLGIFSLTVFVMVAAITRVTMVDPNGLPPEASWIFFWSNIELTISIVIACIASFRQLFVHASKQRKQQNPSGSSSPKGLLSWFHRRRTGANATGSPVQEPANEWDRRTHIIPLDSIHVSYSISVSASNSKIGNP